MFKIVNETCSPTASGCIEEDFLINGPHPLPGIYMTASSSYDDRHGPEYATLHNTYVEGVTIGSWCPVKTDWNAGTSFIQVRTTKHSTPMR